MRPAYAAALAIALLIAVAMRAGPARAQSLAPSPAPNADVGTSAGALEIEVIGLRNDSGQVGCSLFNDPSAFPRDDTRMVRHVWAPIQARKATCRFPGIAPGQYAAVVYHDENGNHEFDQNAFGMPEEGYGFSNDAAALFSPPDFQAAAFSYDGNHLYIIVNMRY